MATINKHTITCGETTYQVETEKMFHNVWTATTNVNFRGIQMEYRQRGHSEENALSKMETVLNDITEENN